MIRRLPRFTYISSLFHSLPTDALRRTRDLPELVKAAYAFNYGGELQFMGIGYKTNGESDIEGGNVFESINHVLAFSLASGIKLKLAIVWSFGTLGVLT